MEHEAIYKLYPNAVNVNEDGNGGFSAMDIDGNEITIDMSAVNTKATELKAEADAKAQTEIELKASAKAKLIAGEKLTEEEADLMIGV